MSESGIVQRKDLYLIWEQKHFKKLSPYKEFIFDMLIHLDILSEQRRYDTTTGSRLPVENFFVPCMLIQRNDTRFMTHECTPEKAISLAFVFKGTIIPPALPNRLISACLSMWTVKTYEGKQLLFSGFVGLSFDKAHTIVVCVEGNKILLYIVHETSIGLIVPDIATGIKECLFTTLERISEFYKSTVSSSSQKLPFHIEYACSRLECHVTEEAALTTDEWICDKHKIVHTKDKWNIWNQDQTKEQCEMDCQGLQTKISGAPILQPQFVKYGGISQNMIESQKEDEYVPQTTLQYLTEESEKESSMRKPRRNKRDMTQLQTILQTNVIPVSQKWSRVLDSIMDKIMKFPELAKILKRYFIDFISFIRTTE
ncbi:Hypothetical predicted protein [Mytilus galloprovincialis]|uniref:Uncharacterized protein n=1 Tax=Mytilus galloprovincialis TaxID=29158 RepID=A0A8B6CWU4_MYTGA|nr:Hypothetical predicted protein [Mytilus galloprovincialis]